MTVYEEALASPRHWQAWYFYWKIDTLLLSNMLGFNKLRSIFKTIFSNAFSWLNVYAFRLFKFVSKFRINNIAILVLIMAIAWWRQQMATFSALLSICAGNSPVPGEFPAQRPVTWSFDVFFDLRLNKILSKQSWSWWSETPSSSLWRHRNDLNQWWQAYWRIDASLGLNGLATRFSQYQLWCKQNIHDYVHHKRQHVKGSKCPRAPFTSTD